MQRLHSRGGLAGPDRAPSPFSRARLAQDVHTASPHATLASLTTQPSIPAGPPATCPPPAFPPTPRCACHVPRQRTRDVGVALHGVLVGVKLQVGLVFGLDGRQHHLGGWVGGWGVGARGRGEGGLKRALALRGTHTHAMPALANKAMTTAPSSEPRHSLPPLPLHTQTAYRPLPACSAQTWRRGRPTCMPGRAACPTSPL